MHPKPKASLASASHWRTKSRSPLDPPSLFSALRCFLSSRRHPSRSAWLPRTHSGVHSVSSWSASRGGFPFRCAKPVALASSEVRGDCASAGPAFQSRVARRVPPSPGFSSLHCCLVPSLLWPPPEAGNFVSPLDVEPSRDGTGACRLRAAPCEYTCLPARGSRDVRDTPGLSSPCCVSERADARAPHDRPVPAAAGTPAVTAAPTVGSSAGCAQGWGRKPEVRRRLRVRLLPPLATR